MERRNQPIAVFDSGVGGISVLREMVRLMPNENFYFRGDSIHAPFGTRPFHEIQKLTLDNIAHMAQKGIKGIVIACNTATSVAIELLRNTYIDIPVVGIEPALKPAVMESRHGKVLVMATPMTVHAEKFCRLMAQYQGEAEIIPLGCPGLMEFVEAGSLEGPRLQEYLKKLLTPKLLEGVNSIVLGCTHYPFVRGAIREITGPGPHLIDGSEGTARELQRRLDEFDLLTDRKERGTVVFEESIPDKIKLCRFLLERDVWAE
ncbi:MAG: glutamate racemase [Lachnospiraceae bacterium]|nr:glutamate racemase [Lachnospiraceae bacterium]